MTNLKEYEGLSELTSYRNSKPQDMIDIPINLKDIRGPEWPEIVDDGNMIVGGQSIQSSVSAIPRNKIKNDNNRTGHSFMFIKIKKDY